MGRGTGSGGSMGNFFYCAEVYITQNLHFEQFKMLSRIKSAHCCASITIIHLQNFSFSQTETLTHRKSLLFPYSPVASILLSVSWNFTIPGNSKSGIRRFALLHLPIFILNNVPQSHPCCSWCQNFRLNGISSYGENTFCVFISIFWLV